MSMTLRTNLANVQTSAWTGPSRHSFIGWARITQMRRYFLSIGSTSYVNIFITSTLLFSKSKRKKKQFKDEAEANKQAIFIIFLTSQQKLNFKIFNIKSKSLMLMVIMMQKISIENHLVLSISEPKHGHKELFNSLHVFIQQFLKKNYRF
jgi:hypothetical protein